MAEQQNHDVKDDLEGYKNFVPPPVKTTLVWNGTPFHRLDPQGYDIDFDANVQWGCMPTEALLLSLAAAWPSTSS
jgi:hypothetical protein